MRPGERAHAGTWLRAGGLAAWFATAPPGIASVPPPAAPDPAPAAGTATSHPLPFVPAPAPGQRFSVSDLTKNYDEHLATFANPEPNPSGAPRLETLDRIAATPEPDSSRLRVVRDAREELASLPEEEKKELDPPRPPVSAGIPSPIAIAGSLAGGLVLLVKLVSALAR